jgi:hypothetical protein
MSEAIIVALITGAAAVVAYLIIARQSNRDLYAKLDKQSEVSDAKIQGEIDVIKADIRTLSNRVEQHNKLVERTYALESRADVQDEQIRVANHRISDLEKKGA